MQLDVSGQVILLGAAMAVVLGAVANKTNFCTMGAVSDWVNMGDTGRLRSWFLAMAVAILGVSLLEATSLLDADSARVPYRGSLFFWPRYLLGGLMFGVGMTLASGCGNKTLVRIGGGNLKSLLVAVVAGAMAYLMTRTDFYGLVFHSWMLPLSPDLALNGVSNQSLGAIIGTLLGAEDTATVNVILGLILGSGTLLLLFRSRGFRSSLDPILGGITVGLVIVGGWYVTGGPLGLEWMEAVDFMDAPPPGTGTQSYTFINPMGETLIYLSAPQQTRLITFGVAALLGVVAGSMLFSLLSGRFRLEWFVDTRDFLRHLLGGVLMGIGGVLSFGCTIGQGVTGVSTLALGSFMALGAIIFGSTVTMKIQYYTMLLADQEGFAAVITNTLVDLHLLPASLRKSDDA